MMKYIDYTKIKKTIKYNEIIKSWYLWRVGGSCYSFTI